MLRIVRVGNRQDETLDGDKFELDEPPPGVVWTRADYQLPSEGVLKVTDNAFEALDTHDPLPLGGGWGHAWGSALLSHRSEADPLGLRR